MLDLIKHLDYFDPSKVKDPIHIIGLGAMGSSVAELLTRLGIQKLNIYDFDTVSLHNLTNQMFRYSDIGTKKTDAVESICKSINPEIKIKKFENGYTTQRLSGYIFLCVDNIETRKKICEQNKTNMFIKGIFDFRMGLEQAQHYFSPWKTIKDKDDFLETMAFSHEEAKENTPVSPCGTELSVTPTVRAIIAAGVANFINYTKTKDTKKLIIVNPFANTILAV